ncbi:hypothetical protein ABCW43_00305 [Neorhizobium sp. IRAMC:178]|uniref:hypothetical protein n=1 Tax=Neorhizobium tunisiense TaxID=3144793 RepID=UPI0031F6E472
MSNVTVTKKTTISVRSDEISAILRNHFKTPDDAWVEYIIVDYGDTFDRAEMSWTVEDIITSPTLPVGGSDE